jgi:peptidoglycan/xylan/chitin deacetylase (PgdA/CDA1 family)
VPLRDAGSRVLRIAAARRAALRVAAAGGRALILLYHRITPGGGAPHDVVPAVPIALFQRHVEALADLGDVVPLARLLEPPDSARRVRIAITLDDDDDNHVRHALPILQAAAAPATFFLSGRALRGLGPYWWVVLERLVAERGLAEACAAVGAPAASAVDLAARCEGSPAAERLAALGDGGTPPLARAEMRALADAGMTVGFHTLRHPVLTALPDDVLAEALVNGRADLAALLGRPVDLFAYPHGRADARVARAARSAGYRAAFGSRGRPVHRGSDPFLLGRWEPGPLPVEELVASVALRLNLPTAARRR